MGQVFGRGAKGNATDNTCYGHNAEFAWLLNHALDVLKENRIITAIYFVSYTTTRLITESTMNMAFMWKVHSGGVYDREKEFWQQAEVLIGLLDAVILLGDENILKPTKMCIALCLTRWVNKGAVSGIRCSAAEVNPSGRTWAFLENQLPHREAMVQSILRLEKIIDN